MCYKKIGNYEESVKDYTNAIKLEGTNGNFYYNRAISYMCLSPPDYDKVSPPSSPGRLAGLLIIALLLLSGFRGLQRGSEAVTGQIPTALQPRQLSAEDGPRQREHRRPQAGAFSSDARARRGQACVSACLGVNGRAWPFTADATNNTCAD